MEHRQTIAFSMSTLNFDYVIFLVLKLLFSLQKENMSNTATFARGILNGKTGMGWYWRGGAAMVLMDKDYKNDRMYIGLDKGTTALAAAINSDAPGREEFIKKLKAELDALCPAVNSSTLTDEQRSLWITNIWALEKAGAIQNDSMTGIQIVSLQLMK